MPCNVPKLLTIVAHDFSSWWYLVVSEPVVWPLVCVTTPTIPEPRLCVLVNTLTVGIRSVISILFMPGNCYSVIYMLSRKPVTKVNFCLPMYPANLLILLAYMSTDSPLHLIFFFLVCLKKSFRQCLLQSHLNHLLILLIFLTHL